MKATVIADHRGRTLWADGLRPGRMHAVTAARAAGITGCFRPFDLVEILLDDGYLGLSRDHPGQAVTPPRKSRPGALAGRVEQWERDRHGHSSDPITVEHARGRPQTLEATHALHSPPRPAARHQPRHRWPRLRPDSHRLNTDHAPTRHDPTAITHQLVGAVVGWQPWTSRVQPTGGYRCRCASTPRAVFN